MQSVSYYIINAFCLVDKMFYNLKGSWRIVKKAAGLEQSGGGRRVANGSERLL